MANSGYLLGRKGTMGIQASPPPARRLETLHRFRSHGILTQATLSPLMPLADSDAFARRLDAACDRVIVDHYLMGDGSRNR
jgi:DNA repair photolyase